MLYEGQHHVYRQGHVAEDSREVKVNLMIGLLDNPVIAQWWDGKVAQFGPKYFEHIESRRNDQQRSWSMGSIGKGPKSAT